MPSASLQSRFCFGPFRPSAQQQQLPATPVTPATTPSSSQSQPANTSSTSASAAQPGQPQGQNAVNTDRLFGVLPNYATVETEHEFGPLTVKDKFKLTADSMFDPVTFPFIGLEALISQAQNSDPEFGQGLKGYGARYGTAYGDALFGTTMTTSVFPSLLHQDPRYFQLGRGSIMHRSLYSVSRIFGRGTMTEAMGSTSPKLRETSWLRESPTPTIRRKNVRFRTRWPCGARTSCGTRCQTWRKNSGPIFATIFRKDKD